MLWEDEPPAQLRVRRVQRAAAEVPVPGRVRRGGPGMPLNMELGMEGDMEDLDGEVRGRRLHLSAPKRPWWRPEGKVGRIFLALGALTFLGGFLTCAVLLRNLLEHDARFRIAGAADIQASGLTEVSRAEMLPVFGEDIGRNVFFVPLELRRKQLESIPWIEHATVMRLLPDQIRVNVVERKPVAFTRLGSGEAQQIGLVDADGVLLTMPPAAMARHHYSFPVLTGIDAGDPASSRRARMAVYERMMSDLDSTGQHNSEQISEIDLTDPEDARVLMPEQGADILAHFGEDHFLERYQRYKAHIAEWRRQYPHLAAVDLRYDAQVVLQMASGRQAADADPDAAIGASGAAPNSSAKPAAGEPAASASSTAPKVSGGASSHAKHKQAAEKKKRLQSPRAALAPGSLTHAADAVAGGA
jgi:cell division protein FtsQ